MPFVTVISPLNNTGLDQGLVDIIEIACKKAWVSMGGDEQNVGGVAGNIVGSGIYPFDTLRIIFQYVDRGEKFAHNLRNALKRELAIEAQNIQCGVDVVLMPTKTWFKDPVWSQVPCKRPHREGLTL